MEAEEKKIKKAATIIEAELSYVYCNNCKENKSEGDCDDCNRKAMGWGISSEAAEIIARKILK